MNRHLLDQYTALKNEIKLYENKIDELRKKKIDIVADTVVSSAKFPFSPHSIKISGFDWKSNRKRVETINKYTRLIEEAKIKAEKQEVEVFKYIQEIEDSTLRQIFIYKFIDRLTDEKIAEKISYDRSTISCKIREYLNKETSPKSPKKMC